MSVTGKVSGTATVKNRIEIHKNGVVRADLNLSGPSLIIEEGGILEGRVSMGAGPARAKDKERPREKVRSEGSKFTGVAALDS